MKPFDKILGKLSKIKLSVLCSVIAVMAIFVCFRAVQADTASNMSGYYWSSNIGWISLNDCSNVADSSTCTPASSYGVNILPVAPGTIKGYAWSSNIGWITFNDPSCPTADVPGCIPGAYADWNNPNTDGSVNIKGWARVCSIYVSGCSGALNDTAVTGGWDGYIALDSSSAGGGATSGTWGLQIGSDKSTVSGYAWGSEVIGWIKGITSKVYLGGPTAQLVAAPSTITSGATSRLTVTATNIGGANSCTIPGVSTLIMAQSSGGIWKGTATVSPTVTTPYTVTCTNGVQQAKDTATVTVLFIQPQTLTYCAAPGTHPNLAWDSDATSCTISEGSSSVTVSPSSQAEAQIDGIAQSGDGFYYVPVGIPVPNSGGTYTLRCTGGSQPGPVSIVVNACHADFRIQAVAIAPTTLTLSADGKTMSESFIVSVAHFSNGFNLPIDLSISSWTLQPPVTPIPNSRVGTFDVPQLIYNTATNTYSTAVLTITVDASDVTQTVPAYDPITLLGTATSGLTSTTPVLVGAKVKVKPIFNEF